MSASHPSPTPPRPLPMWARVGAALVIGTAITAGPAAVISTAVATYERDTAPAFVLPDWQAATPCPSGAFLVDTEQANSTVAGIESDGLTCEAQR